MILLLRRARMVSSSSSALSSTSRMVLLVSVRSSTGTLNLVVFASISGSINTQNREKVNEGLKRPLRKHRRFRTDQKCSLKSQLSPATCALAGISRDGIARESGDKDEANTSLQSVAACRHRKKRDTVRLGPFATGFGRADFHRRARPRGTHPTRF